MINYMQILMISLLSIFRNSIKLMSEAHSIDRQECSSFVSQRQSDCEEEHSSMHLLSQHPIKMEISQESLSRRDLSQSIEDSCPHIKKEEERHIDSLG